MRLEAHVPPAIWMWRYSSSRKELFNFQKLYFSQATFDISYEWYFEFYLYGTRIDLFGFFLISMIINFIDKLFFYLFSFQSLKKEMSMHFILFYVCTHISINVKVYNSKKKYWPKYIMVFKCQLLICYTKFKIYHYKYWIIVSNLIFRTKNQIICEYVGILYFEGTKLGFKVLFQLLLRF